MKNQFKIKLTYILIVATCFLATSCNGQNDAKSTEGKAPKVAIHTAIITNNMETLKQHIEFGKDLKEKEPMNGSSPLMTAIVFNKTEMATMLINANADLSIQNNDGSTALHIAAFFCRPEIVKLLLDKGANRTIKNAYGQTPYETVAGAFTEAKDVYKGLSAMLEPMGLKLDLGYIEKTRPEVASLLK
ncbi:ankyrin repeat domain-containing protein [Paucihalobacter sp.]|uniref:ankyrin repeat domain-containing protein n=1 Tax=Paucihalobacter sp. TaxID=2850405 RepID=UPI002FE16A1A